MTSPTRAVVLVLVVVLCLVLTEQIARGLGLEPAVGLLSLANLGTLVIGIKLGWRQALLGVGSLAVLTIPAAMMALFLAIMLIPDVGMRNRMVSQERALHMARGSDLKLLEQAAAEDPLAAQAH